MTTESVQPARRSIRANGHGAEKLEHGRADAIDVSRLSPAEQASLRRQLDRLHPNSPHEASKPPSLDAACGLIRTAGAARTSREDEVRYRVDPDIWDLPQFASTPFDQLVT